MSHKDLLKIGGIAATIVGAGVSIVSDMIGKKQMVNDLAKSKEVKKLINNAVKEAIKNK